MKDDLISRQAAIDALAKFVPYAICDESTESYTNGLTDAYNLILQLPSAQPATNCSEFPNNSDTISREAVADAINGIECTRHTTWYEFYQKVMTAVEKLPPAQPETLTDKEQRIFLAAMGREEKVCKQVDEECRDCREPYEDSLVRVCHEIERKVKGALWTI